MRSKRLQKSFFLHDTHVVAKELLGKILVRRIGKTFLQCRIVEVESYVGENDLASHASRGRTLRTEPMFAEGGHAYVYFIYGMYWCFNVVTEDKDFPAAVLIRAAEPLSGIPFMQEARKRINPIDLMSGPGKLCQALAVDKSLNGEDLTTSKQLYIADDGFHLKKSQIRSSARIGVAYAGKHAHLPWRYYVTDSPFVSKARPYSK